MCTEHKSPRPNCSLIRPFLLGLALSCLLAPAIGSPQSAAGNPPATPAAKQRSFESAKQAVEALIQAAEQGDLAALIEMIGEDNRDLVVTEDEVQARNTIAEFAAKAKEKHTLAKDPKDKNRVMITIGNEDWPMAIPIVKEKGKWRFDSAAGRQEILCRRIGDNELDAIQICRGFVEAQHEYALQKREGFQVNQYAQRIISTPGKQDGLAWRNPDGTWSGPVGENVAQALEEGYSDRAKPCHGYYFKILKGQGPAAPLGELNFVIKGAMIGGFALAAAPAEYGVTGVKSFIVSHDGVVYEQDLGPDTLKLFKELTLFNPDETWSPVSED
jgi:hypothetical protein